MKIWNGCAERALKASLCLSPFLAGCQEQSMGTMDDAAVMPPVGGDEPAMALTMEQLMDPKACKDCHPKHYREWASSMHAYSTKDPVFRAMNARGQEETGNELGQFCVNCHAPLATAQQLLPTGSNEELDALDPDFASVNCYFCHNVAGFVETDDPNELLSNNPLQLAMDNVMRGSLEDAVKPPAHDVAYSPLMDGFLPESTDMCGPCHDIVTPRGFHLEETFAEWKTTVFALTDFSPGDRQTCNTCHMDTTDGLAAETDTVQVGNRDNVHEHLFAGLDVALTDDHPDAELQYRAIECAVHNAGRIISMIPSVDGTLTLQIETDAGHAFPSGATQDRRVWIEIKIIDQMGTERHIGLVPDGMSVVDATKLPENEGMATFFHEILDESGEVTHDFWEAVDRRGSLLKPPSLNFDHTVKRTFKLFEMGAPQQFWPARIEVTMHARTLGYDVVNDLVETGHLKDASVIEKIPSFIVDNIVWDSSKNELNDEIKLSDFRGPDCPNHYRCLLSSDPESCP